MNPFRFEGPIAPEHLIGRDGVVAELVRNAVERRVVSVAAPRRYGKTSVLRAAGAVLEREHGFVVAHVDLLGLSGPEDFAARFGSAWRRATAEHKRLRRAVDTVAGGLSGFGVTILGSGLQVSREPRHPDAVLTVVHTLLDLPGDAEPPVLIVLDEFQALHAAWEEGEGVLRSHSQSPHQAGRVAYAFAGSEPSLLAAAFADAGRAYYQQALQVPVDRLADPVLAAGIAAAFEASGREPGPALSALVALADGHPQRAMLLAHLLWDRAPLRRPADLDDWEHVLATARSLVAGEAQAIWESLTPVQRSALRRVLSHGSATRGPDRDATRPGRQSAQKMLLRRGLIEADTRPGPRGGTSYRLVDPMLADWIQQRSGPASD